MTTLNLVPIVAGSLSVTPGSSGTLGASVQTPGGLTVARWSIVNVMLAGAVGDGVTDDTAAIQSAISSVAATGGIVYFPQGIYKITSGLVSSNPNLVLCGVGGMGQSNLLGLGCSVIFVSGAITGFTFNPAAASTIFNGPVIGNLFFKGTSSGTGGIKLNRCNNFALENVSVSDFTAGFGVYSDGTGNVNQYGAINNLSAGKCLIGLDTKLTNGLRVLGGMIDANDNSGAIAAGSTGIRIQSGDTVRIIGMVIQYAAKGIDLQSGEQHAISDIRLEGFTTGITIGATAHRASVLGGSFNNSILGGSSGTGISITAGALNPLLLPASMQSLSTNISDPGSGGSTYLYDGFLHLDDGLNLFSAGTGVARLQDNLHIELNLVVDRGGAGHRVIFGGTSETANTSISAHAGTPEANVTAPAGSLCMDTTNGKLYVKASGAGNTGWVVAGTQT